MFQMENLGDIQQGVDPKVSDVPDGQGAEERRKVGGKCG